MGGKLPTHKLDDSSSYRTHSPAVYGVNEASKAQDIKIVFIPMKILMPWLPKLMLNTPKPAYLPRKAMLLKMTQRKHYKIRS